MKMKRHIKVCEMQVKKAVLKGKLIALNTLEKKRSHISDFSFDLKLENEKIKLKVSRKK